MAKATRLALAAALCGALVAPPATAAPVGELTYADCYTANADACGPGKSGIPKLSDAIDVAVSPDGRNVYAASFNDSAVTHFDRDTATGALTRVDCVTATTGCGLPNDSKPGLTNPSALVVSGDGRTVYVTSSMDDSIVTLRREASGALTYLGCISSAAAPTPDCGPGKNSKPGLDGASDVDVSRDGRALALVGFDGNSMAFFERDASSGVLTYGGCFSEAGGAGCAAAPAPGLQGATGVAFAGDRRSIFTSAFTSKAIARFGRDPDSGAITYAGRNTDPSLNSAQTVRASPDGRSVYATSVQSTHAVSTFDRDGASLTFRDCFDAGSVCGAGRDGIEKLLFPYGLSVAPDGRSVYVVSLYTGDGTIHRFDRGPDGALTRRECQTSSTGCGPGNDALAQLKGMMRPDVAPDGRDVYVAGATNALVRFRRVPDERPVCSPPATVNTTAGTAVEVPLNCGDANGDAFSTAFPTSPQHGTLVPGGGSVVVTPAVGFTGDDSFSVRPTDGFGVSGPVSTVTVRVAAPGDALAPTVEQLVMPRALRAAARGESITRKATAVGGRVRYRLSEPATTTFTVERKTTGRRSGRRCVKATKRNRKARKCTRYVAVRGSFTHQGAAGANSFKFSGRIAKRKLPVAAYRLVAVATDAAGNKSAARRRAFRIVKR